MAVSTQTDAELTITLDDGDGAVDYSAQVINAEFTPASTGSGTIVPTATGETVTEPGDPEPGQITGEVFKDTATAGFTRALLAAVQAGTEFDYVYIENPETADELKYTGKATVPAFAVPFAPTKYGRHSITLQLATSVLADPYVAP